MGFSNTTDPRRGATGVIEHLTGGVPGVYGDRMVFYVSNATYLKPGGNHFTTISQALTACRAYRGDVIVVRAGYTQAISAAAGLDFNVAGVTVVGEGGRAGMPVITLDTTVNADVDITAADVTLENLHFAAGFPDITHCIDITAAGATIRNCVFSDTSAFNFLIAITLGVEDNDSDHTTIEKCQFLALDTSNTHAIYIAKEQEAVSILGNFIVGDYVGGGGPIEAGNAEEQLFILIRGNMIHNTATDAVTSIKIAPGATNTGLMMWNYAAHADTDGDTPFIGVGLGFFMNYGSGVMGTASGYLYPTVDS